MEDQSKGRLGEFKNKGRDEDALRFKRREHSVEIRKSSRADQLMKKRQIEGIQEPKALTSEQANVLLAKAASYTSGNEYLDMELRSIAMDIMNDLNPELQYNAVRKCRKLLSKTAGPPIKAVVATGIIPKVVSMLAQDSNPQLQFEAAWVLTNIASGQSEDTYIVYDAGALPLLLRLVASDRIDVREQAVWAIGNIVGDGPQLRDKVMEVGGLELILNLLRTCDHVPTIRHATWTISNFCRGKEPRPDFERVFQCVPMLSHLVSHADENTVIDAVWAVSYLADNAPENLERLLQTNIHAQLLPYVQGTAEQPIVNPDLLLPVLRTFGNITTGTNEQTQRVVDLNILTCFPGFLRHERENIRKEAAWLISNIAAGTPLQIQYIIDLGLFPHIMACFAASDFRVRREVAWIVVNVAWKGTPEQKYYVACQGGIRVLLEMIDVHKSRDVHLLEGINSFLEVGVSDQGNVIAQMVEEANGLEGIEKLTTDENEAISTKAIAIIDKFFSRDEDNMDGFNPREFSLPNYPPPGGFDF